jgi:hypothetical protein
MIGGLLSVAQVGVVQQAIWLWPGRRLFQRSLAPLGNSGSYYPGQKEDHEEGKQAGEEEADLCRAGEARGWARRSNVPEGISATPVGNTPGENFERQPDRTT